MSVYEEIEYKKKFDLQLWKKLLGYMKPYRHLMALLILVMVCVGSVEASFPLMTRYAIDSFIIPGKLDGLTAFAFKYLALILFQVFNVWSLITLAGRVDMGICYDIRKRGFQRLQELSFSYYDRTPVGWIMARMTSDAQKLCDTVAWGMVDLVWGFAMMSTIAVYMFYLNWKLALAALAVIPPLAAISMYFQQKILGAYRKVRKTNSKITGAFNEGITGAKTTKILVTQKRNLAEFKELTDEMYASSVHAAVLSSVYLPIVLTLGSIGTALALRFGSGDALAGTLTFGTLVAFISYTIQFFEPVREVARVLAELIAAQASAERIVSMVETEPEVKDAPEVVQRYGDAFTSKRENWPALKGDISFRNVSFSYKEGQEVLKDFSLDIKAGETIALVGETGSGKSTVVNLACRFYEPTSGEILIDGVDYRKRSQLWLHSNLGYVLQTPHLFSGSIRENIAYGRLDATEKDIIRAAKTVKAHDFIIGLEKGYDTEVGEGGCLLSTGQKQLVSMARAILADPRIFVLDEATSSVDTETEKTIQEAVQKILCGRTSFIIAHRLSTIRAADRILVIHKGRMIEEGSHASLLRRKGYYCRLYMNQFLDEQGARVLNA